MGTIASKFKLGLWFLKKGYFAQALFMLNKSKKDGTRQESTEWCHSIAITEDEVLRILDIPVKSLETDHIEHLQYAQRSFEDCPIEMGGAGSTKVLYSFVSAKQPNCVVETGVAYGWSSLPILLGIKNNPTAHLWSIDMPYPNLDNDQYVGCVVKDDLKNNWTLIRKPDLYAVPEVLKSCEAIDFCHYDSDKSYKGRMKSGELIWAHLNKGGFLMMDDINDNIAFKDFCENKNRDPIVFRVENKYVGLIQK